MAILAPTSSQNNSSGNGKFKPLARKKKENSEDNSQFNEDLLYKKDRQMRFKNAKDPVYVAFEYLERQPLKQLAIDFIKDSFTEVFIFVSKFN